MVSLERKGALDERDTLVSQLYKEKEENKKLQKDVCGEDGGGGGGAVIGKEGDVVGMGMHLVGWYYFPRNVYACVPLIVSGPVGVGI